MNFPRLHRPPSRAVSTWMIPSMIWLCRGRSAPSSYPGAEDHFPATRLLVEHSESLTTSALGLRSGRRAEASPCQHIPAFNTCADLDLVSFAGLTTVGTLTIREPSGAHAAPLPRR